MNKRHLSLTAAILAALPFAAEAKRPNNKLNGIDIRNTHEPVIRSSTTDLTDIISKGSQRVVVIPEMPTTILRWWMKPRVGTWPIDQAGIIPAVYAEKGLRQLMVGIPIAGVPVSRESYERVSRELTRWNINPEVAGEPSSEVEHRLRRKRAPESEIQRILDLHNPQGWHIMGKRIQNEGWDAMDQYMVEFEALDPPIKTVWFWNWSGVDSTAQRPVGAHANPMGWPDKDFLPEGMFENWLAWRAKWEERGFKFGIWCSTPAYPNTGTWNKPVRNWLKYQNEDGSTYVMNENDPNAAPDIDWFVDHMAELHQECGFDYIGLDALNHLYELRDEPPHRDINYLPAGPRERGITTAFFLALTTDTRLQNCQIIAETHLPPNHLHALMPTMFTVSGANGPKSKLDEIGDEEHHKLIPGCEVIAHMYGTDWTEQEWPTGTWPGPVYEELLNRGYTPTIDFPLLNEHILQPMRDAGVFANLPSAPATTPLPSGPGGNSATDDSSPQADDSKKKKNRKKKNKKKKRRKLPVKTWR